MENFCFNRVSTELDRKLRILKQRILGVQLELTPSKLHNISLQHVKVFPDGEQKSSTYKQASKHVDGQQLAYCFVFNRTVRVAGPNTLLIISTNLQCNKYNPHLIAFNRLKVNCNQNLKLCGRVSNIGTFGELGTVSIKAKTDTSPPLI